tara:strand:- start:31 stop:387 length:357 start_codon:yes stop_codon:yes gene_type:complete
MIIEILLGLFIITTIVLGYTTYNLYNKVETYEDREVEFNDTINRYNTWMDEFSLRVGTASVRLKEIDNRGTFSSDDEVGIFFTILKDLMEKIINMTDELNIDTNQETDNATQETQEEE